MMSQDFVVLVILNQVSNLLIIISICIGIRIVSYNYIRFMSKNI